MHLFLAHTQSEHVPAPIQGVERANVLNVRFAALSLMLGCPRSTFCPLIKLCWCAGIPCKQAKLNRNRGVLASEDCAGPGCCDGYRAAWIKPAQALPLPGVSAVTSTDFLTG